MARKIYTLTPDDALQNVKQIPEWFNKPQKINKDDPYWDNGLPPGPRTDPGSLADGVGSGFPLDMPPPLLVFEKPLGSLPLVDVILYGRPEWLLSEHAKRVFESVDPSAFEFREATSRLHDGTAGPNFWLCDVVRFLDAVDEQRSDVFVEVKMSERFGRPYKRVRHGIAGNDVFKASVVGDCHVFHALYSPSTVFCDDVMVAAMRAAQLTGVQPYLQGELDA